MPDDASTVASVNPPQVMRFRAIADADPHAIVCILQHLQVLNVVPKALTAHRLANTYVEINVETDSLSYDTFRCMVSKINEMPMVIAAVAFDVDWSHSPARA